MRRRTDERQPALALVPARALGPVTDADRQAAARRVRIGPPGEELWLYWRAERAEYSVARYDRASGRSRYVGTGIGAGDSEHPPREAHEALAAHFAIQQRPARAQAPAEVGISAILTRYQAEHAAHIADPARASYAVMAIERFIAAERRRGALDLVTAAHLGKSFVKDYARFRRGEGVATSTIERELTVFRAAVSWAAEDEMIAFKPHIPKMQPERGGIVKPQRVAYSLAQLAAILDAAWAVQDRRHVHLFIVTMLASHARTEAILECDLDTQYQDGVIDWLGVDRGQTKKRRPIVPVGPTLAAWLEGRTGKLIRWRSLKARRTWADDKVPEYAEREAFDIHKGFEGALLAAGAAHPGLKLRRPVLDANGEQMTRLIKHRVGAKFVPLREEPVWKGIGYPNAIRHTIHTQLKRIGVPDGQIDAAAGHAQQGTGRHYNHFDAHRDLKDFTAGVEQLFDELRHYTTTHLHTQDTPKVIDLGAARASMRS